IGPAFFIARMRRVIAADHVDHAIANGLPQRILMMSFTYRRIHQRDKVRATRAESDGAYDVSNNSCMTHVMDVLNAGGADVPAKGKRAWAFLNRHGVGPRVR
ncbi:hypothetical protein G3O00_25135, partial [Burkholderia sp. Ac-20384]|uniref:hypothetical protein n=1 Tax=Burkholderia sp. Ac-20384 TaxID=2703902 RepID=UPI00197F773B